MQTVSTTMSVPFVDLEAQYRSIKSEVDNAMASVIARTAFVGGPFVKDFEEAFARYCGVANCLGVANGTDALAIALRTLGIGPGDEVITVANTFVATSEAIKMAGAQVVFVDIKPKTYNIDVTRIEEKITPRTKAIVPVHLYGQPVRPRQDQLAHPGLLPLEDDGRQAAPGRDGQRIAQRTLVAAAHVDEARVQRVEPRCRDVALEQLAQGVDVVRSPVIGARDARRQVGVAGARSVREHRAAGGQGAARAPVAHGELHTLVVSHGADAI